jgi:hypothetical protein
MKKCNYCGRESDEGNRVCAQCGAEEFRSLSADAADSLASDQPLEPKYRIPELPPNAEAHDWVTLVKCGHMVEADGLCAHLNGVGIETFIPDENLMLTVSWGLNVYGYVRVQVKPAQYDRARELLHEMGEAVLV